VILASLVLGFAVAFITDPKRQGTYLVMRRSIWVIALIAWFAIISLVADEKVS
jgi:hypothetical protein